MRQQIEATKVPFLAEVAALRVHLVNGKARGDAETDLRGLVAQIGGVHRRWRQSLVQVLTEAAFDGLPTSREKMRAWQRQVFGRAVSSGLLARYAISTRSGGGRSGFVDPPSSTVEAVAALFKEHCSL